MGRRRLATPLLASIGALTLLLIVAAGAGSVPIPAGDVLAAVGRGVDVAGIIDADQGFQPWNAVPQLRDGGVDARYYPGALTGASGRMHHKPLVVDRALTYLATANASQAAEKSFELSLSLKGTEVAGFVDAEILRLGANASVSPINPL